VASVPDRAKDALVPRSHQTIHPLGLPILPLFEGFGSGIGGHHVSAPRLPKYRELAHMPGNQWMRVIHVSVSEIDLRLHQKCAYSGRENHVGLLGEQAISSL
jgi:hypothetical protein